MKIGYARVSTKDQKLSLQKDALQKEGCEVVFEEKASGAKFDRPELCRMIDQLRKNDIVVIWKLDRLGRSLRELVNLVTEIQNKGAGLKSLNLTPSITHPFSHPSRLCLPTNVHGSVIDCCNPNEAHPSHTAISQF